jgi:hypothetical protein
MYKQKSNYSCVPAGMDLLGECTSLKIGKGGASWGLFDQIFFSIWKGNTLSPSPQ